MKLHRNFIQRPFTLDRLIKVKSYRSLAPAVGHVSSQFQTVIENQTKKMPKSTHDIAQSLHHTCRPESKPQMEHQSVGDDLFSLSSNWRFFEIENLEDLIGHHVVGKHVWFFLFDF